MVKFIKFLIAAASATYNGMPFAQCLHDGGTIQKRKFEAVGLQFVGPKSDKNFVVVIGFELIRKGKAGDIAQLIEHCAQHTLGKSIASVSNSVCSDAAAMAVANDDEVFPGGVTSELCLMHQTMKMGQTGVGQLERTKMKVIQNEFVEGKKLYNMVHRLASFFSYSDRLRELHVHCITTKCVKIRLKLDVNTTRVTAIWALFMSVLRMKSAIVAYTASLTIIPKELDLVHQDFIDMAIFEAVLNTTRITTTLAQYEQHCNRAYRPLYKFQALKQLRQDYLWVIDASQLSTNLGPRPTRVKVFKRDMSDRAKEMWRKAQLEMERRWCTNVTEEINNSALVHTDHDLLVSVLDLRTVTCPHIDSTYEIPRLRKVLTVAYVKFGLNEFDLQQQAIEVDMHESSQGPKKKKAKEDRRALHVDDQQALVMGLGTRDSVAGCGWGASSDEDEVVVLTVEDRELMEKALEAECTAALKRWVAYGRDLDFTPYLKDRVTKPAAGKTPDVVMLDTDVSPVPQKNYDLMGDLLEADILMLFRQVLREEESLVKVGGQAQFGYLPRMALANIGAMNAESFCERILSCASLVVTDLHTSLDQ